MSVSHAEVDPILEVLGGRGRYQLLQYFVAKLFAFTASFQLFNIVFIGRNIAHVCERPDNVSDIFTYFDDDAFNISNSNIVYDKCHIRVDTNVSGAVYSRELPCVYGYNFSEPPELSIISDMEIVCDRASMRGLGQTVLIGGQGLGAFILPIFSDRYGRRPIHLLSHACVLALAVGVAFSPNYLTFLVLRLFIGGFQQGIVLTDSTIGIETFSTRHRTMVAVLTNLVWSIFSVFLPLVAFLLRHHSWRVTQLGTCSVSVVIIIQFIFLDETIQWLMANKKIGQLEKILRKAARISRVDEIKVMSVFHQLLNRGTKHERQNEASVDTMVSEDNNGTGRTKRCDGADTTGRTKTGDWTDTSNGQQGDDPCIRSNDKQDIDVPSGTIYDKDIAIGNIELHGKSAIDKDFIDECRGGEEGVAFIHDKNNSTDYSHSLLDFVRVKRLGLNVALLWFIWFTDSMTYFGLYMTSDTLAGDRFVNVVLLTVVQMPSSFFIYLLLDRIGRRKTCMALHAIAGFGLVGATVVRSVLGDTQTASLVATVFSCFGFFGMFGAFGSLFFYTPEIFPTNMRNVGLGTSSSFSRIGGMLAPFAGLLAEYRTWAPCAVLASCCLVATLFLTILPETKGRDLPQTLTDVKAWYRKTNNEQTIESEETKTK